MTTTQRTAGPSLHEEHTAAALREFLSNADVMTADPMETAVLAEMAGFTNAQARELGYESLFDAVEQLKPAERVHTRVAVTVPDIAIGVLIRAFLRGLLFVAPLAPLFVLLPRAMSTADFWLVTIAVIVAWGVGMGLSHVTRRHAVESPGTQWRAVVTWNLVALAGIAAVAGLTTVTASGVALAAIAWAGLHVLYVLAANVLIATGGTALLTAALLPGVVAAAVHWGTGGTMTTTPHPMVFGIALASVLAAIVFSLVRIWRLSSGRAKVTNLMRDRAVGGFILYGCLIAAIVLWLPVNTPGFTTGFLSLALIICLGFAEVAARYIRQTGRRSLAGTSSVAEFRTEVQNALGRGVGSYAIALTTVLIIMAAPLVASGHDYQAVFGDTIAVLVLGVIQVLALLGVAYHSMGRITVLLGAGFVALLGTRLVEEMTTDSMVTTGFLVVAVALAVALGITVVRAIRAPVNHY